MLLDIHLEMVFSMSREERLAHKQARLIQNVVGRVKNAIGAAAKNAGRQMGTEVTINTEELLDFFGYSLHVMSHVSEPIRDFMICISGGKQAIGQAFLSAHQCDEGCDSLLDLCEVTHDAQQREAIDQLVKILNGII